jgi:HAD superfamily hydrolase (TIGR01548 family)
METGEGIKPVLVFDMDGVLANVNESYLAAIMATVRHFTGTTVSRAEIDRYKQAGGWNNDWALAHQLVKDQGRSGVAYDEVVAVFQSVFIGTHGDGLITKEEWLPAEDLLPRLSHSYRLAIFTGRPRTEIDISLQRFAGDVPWDKIVADEDVAHPKPAADGLLVIAAAYPGASLTYVGDNVDDARSAWAAGVRFIGVAEAEQRELAKLLTAEGAVAIIPDVNKIEGVL